MGSYVAWNGMLDVMRIFFAGARLDNNGDGDPRDAVKQDLDIMSTFYYLRDDKKERFLKRIRKERKGKGYKHNGVSTMHSIRKPGKK